MGWRRPGIRLFLLIWPTQCLIRSVGASFPTWICYPANGRQEQNHPEFWDHNSKERWEAQKQQAEVRKGLGRQCRPTQERREEGARREAEAGEGERKEGKTKQEGGRRKQEEGREHQEGSKQRVKEANPEVASKFAAEADSPKPCDVACAPCP